MLEENLNLKVVEAKPLVIVGGGWAGLSCAIRLKEKNIQFELYESSRQLGGRARGTKYKDILLDNGQHILSGSCHEFLELLSLQNIKEDEFLARKPLKLSLFDINTHSNIEIKAKQQSNLPTSLYLLSTFFHAKGLSIKQKYQIIKLFLLLKRIKYQVNGDDTPLLYFLKYHHQSKQLITIFWEPLCLAIMNTPIKEASTQIFLNVLNLSFNQKKSDSDLLLFKTSLSKLVLKVTHNIKEHINLSQKIEHLEIRNNTLIGFYIKKKLNYCSQLVLATPFHVTQKLLQPYSILNPLTKVLKQLTYQPIYTLYFKFQSKKTLKFPLMIGLLNSTSQWIFNKNITQDKGIISIVISAAGSHQQQSKDQLIKIVTKELQQVFKIEQPDWSIVVKESKATLSCSVKNNKNRPSQQTAIKGLYLAGDYTQTGLPSTIEGAVLSGSIASDSISSHLSLS